MNKKRLTENLRSTINLSQASTMSQFLQKIRSTFKNSISNDKANTTTLVTQEEKTTRSSFPNKINLYQAKSKSTLTPKIFKIRSNQANQRLTPKKTYKNQR